jgi:hypothetical protein
VADSETFDALHDTVEEIVSSFSSVGQTENSATTTAAIKSSKPRLLALVPALTACS